MNTHGDGCLARPMRVLGCMWSHFQLTVEYVNGRAVIKEHSTWVGLHVKSEHSHGHSHGHTPDRGRMRSPSYYIKHTCLVVRHVPKYCQSSSGVEQGSC